MHVQQFLAFYALSFHPLDSQGRAVECEAGIVELDAPTSKVVQVIDFLSERCHEVGEVFLCNHPYKSARLLTFPL